MQNNQTPAEGLNSAQTESESALRVAACSALRDPATAPKDGRMILVAAGWPWLVPAMWCEYGKDWVIASPQVDFLHGSSVRHFENETEPEILGWMPMPKMPRKVSEWEIFEVPQDEPKDPKYAYRYWDESIHNWVSESCPTRHPRYRVGQRKLLQNKLL